MPTQKVISIPERVIPAREAVLNAFEIGMGGAANLHFSTFMAHIALTDDQKGRILDIILESAATSEALQDATIEDRVIGEAGVEEAAAVDMPS